MCRRAIGVSVGTECSKPETVRNVAQLTRRIWQEKAVGLVYDQYLHKVRVHTAFGDRYGRDEAVTGIIQHLAAFPNCRLHSEEIVWSGEGNHISLWVIRVAHNTGHSVFGGPSGKRVRYPVATDFSVRGGRVAEIWEVHDGLLLVRQLGFGVREAVTALSDWYATPFPQASGSAERSRGQLPPEALPPPASSSDPGDEVESLVRWTWQEVWNRRRFDRIAQHYRSDYRFLGPSGRRLHTRDDFATYVLSLLTAFSNAAVQVESVAVLDADEDSLAAVRWRFFGTHDGPGYGVPTGREVTFFGITHQRIRSGRFVEERTVFDELALLVQLRAPKDTPTYLDVLPSSYP